MPPSDAACENFADHFRNKINTIRFSLLSHLRTDFTTCELLLLPEETPESFVLVDAVFSQLNPKTCLPSRPKTIGTEILSFTFHEMVRTHSRIIHGNKVFVGYSPDPCFPLLSSSIFNPSCTPILGVQSCQPFPT